MILSYMCIVLNYKIILINEYNNNTIILLWKTAYYETKGKLNTCVLV